jgi:pantoate--beta-alanine ligase
MKIIRSVADMQAYALHKRQKNISIGFVPTMGALHAGHLSLVSQSQAKNDVTVVSIFVNPLQFGPKEDLKRYPRTEARDLQALRKEFVNVVFIPKATAMYDATFSTHVHIKGSLGSLWDGAARPGHFDGVATVVAKLFSIVQPSRAYFGEKDFQQLRIIQRLAHDLNLPIEIVPCKTLREPDGLAMSSRNRYLTPKEREEAVKLHQALYLGQELISQKIMKNPEQLIHRLTQILLGIPKAKVDYVAVADPITLEPQKKIQRPVWLAVAVRIGKTRLIDNRVIF